MCKYHGTHGHRTEDCRQLREEVARLFSEGHLQEILSDRDKNHFRERDARKNEQAEPQHVIHMIIGGVDVPERPVFKRIKVSITREKQTRSYVPENILSLCDEEAEGISQPHNDALVLNGFNMASETTKGEIILPVNVAGTIQDTRFHVIEGDMRYNVLLGRPSSPDDKIPNRGRSENSIRRATCCKRDVCNRGSGADTRVFHLREIEHQR
ncbi:uncharacterized protein [Nicotiana sylvestris]|uniref:uncharacterized protein n=1 Tax=Nicotiana sylvestris TaxID=4096 RepID=UPI00388C910E